MSEHTIYYTLPERYPDEPVASRDFYRVETDWWNLSREDLHPWAAQDAAADFHRHHGGWGCEWPMVFALHREEGGPEICRFSVDRETVPEFHASKAG